MIDTTYPVEDGPKGLKTALDRIAKEAEQAVDAGFSFVVLSDRAFGPKRVPISCLLAAGRVHHQLIQVRKTKYFHLISGRSSKNINLL